MKHIKLFEQFTAEAKSVNEAKTYKKGDKLKIKLPNGKKFDLVFVDYSRTKGVALGKFKNDDGEYNIKPFNLDTIVESVNEAKVKTDAKSYQELSQAIDKADEVSDIWNQLDSKLFPIELEEFEDIFDEWWNSNASSYNSVKEFAKNATRADVENLLSHISKSKK